jgi:hypothetical protein
MLTAAESKVGQFYGWQMVAQDLDRLVLHVPIAGRLNPRMLDCSGLAVWAAMQAGVVLTYAPAPTPMDLYYSPALRR